MTLEKETGKNFIEHFGVKGMRWGVSRSKAAIAKDSGGGDSKGESNKAKAPAAKKASTAGNSRNPKKAMEDMSDKELKDYVNRLNMEQQYARMQPTPLSRKAAKFAGDIIVGVAKQQITNALSNEVGKQIGLAKNKQYQKKTGIPAPDKMKREGARLIEAPKGPRLG